MQCTFVPLLLALLLASGVGLAAPPPAPAGAGGALPLGTGPGHHGANSAIPALKERAGIVPWSVLSATRTKVIRNKVLPVFAAPVLALDRKSQRIQGFMMPLEPGEAQSHFLLSSVPVSCPFCVPGGPESLVEVRARQPLKYSQGVVVVEGTFAVLPDDPYGLYYRMTDAVELK